jgi:hypothetical protein
MARTFRLVTLFAALACAGSVYAQSAGGHITGVIIDENGQPVPDVYVTAHGTDQSQRNLTDAKGQFLLHDLVAGRYVLTAARDGYTTVVRNGVMVHVSKTASLPLVMKIADAGVAQQPHTQGATMTARFRGLTSGSTFDGTLPSYNPIESLPPSTVVVAGLGGLQNKR